VSRSGVAAHVSVLVAWARAIFVTVRPVSGFERPTFQWLFILLGIVLIAVAGGAAWHARRTAAAATELRVAHEQARMEGQRLDAQLARERSTREALALELSRQRAGGDAELPRTMPTLTLMPGETRGPTPPAPSVAAQHATQVIELRLLLPRGEHSQYARFEVVLRDWSGGDVLWSRGGLLRSAIDGRAAVTVFLTGDVLHAGSYELLLSGVTRDGKKDEVVHLPDREHAVRHPARDVPHSAPLLPRDRSRCSGRRRLLWRHGAASCCRSPLPAAASGSTDLT